MNSEAVFIALGELDEDMIREARQEPARTRRPRRALLPAAATAVLILGLAAAVGAVAPELRYITAIGDEMVYEEDGDWIMWDAGQEYCFVRDGRILLTLDGKTRDITKKCSDTDYYSWERTYKDGTRQLILVGGTPKAAGCIMVYFFPGGSISFDTPSFYDYRNAPWTAKAEKDYGLEFMLLTSEEPDYGNLDVPTMQELIEHGYPVNVRGETYGFPGVERWLGEPDLVLSRGKNGILGYVRRSETEPLPEGMETVSTPEEALALSEYLASIVPFEVPVYLEDGETVVDWFVIG